MRWGLHAWIVTGAAFLGLKALVDLSAQHHADVAVRAGHVVYHLPASVITNGTGWRADLKRVAGCWDARHDGFVAGLSDLAGCAQPRVLTLDVARLDPRHALVVAHAADAAFWTSYVPPASHLQSLLPLVGRVPAQHAARWQLYRLDDPGTPWVYLLTHVPRSADEAGRAYAGRCYRADIGTDIGMTCTLVERLAGGAAIAVSLGPEGVGSLPDVRAAVAALAHAWAEPGIAAVN